jgi:1,4-dihydroxy-2-naphthoate octaprenyltransferase
MSTTPPSHRRIWIDLLLYPGHTLPTAAAPVVVAVGLAIHDHVFSALPVLLAFLASWLIHVAGVFTDNYLLVAKHPELPEHPELLAALDNGTLTLSGLQWAIMACLALAVLTGPYLLAVAGPMVLVLGIIGIAASLGYSLGPWSMTKLGIADPLFLLMFGIVAVAGAYYVQAASLDSSPAALLVPKALPTNALIVGLPTGALVTNVLLIDDLRDREFDRAKGWRTGPVRFGPNWTRAEFVALMAFAYAAPVWLWLGMGFSAWVSLTWLTLPQAIAITSVVSREQPRDRLVPMTPRTSRLAFDYSVLLAIGIAVFTP